MNETPGSETMWLVYDGQCPLCTMYCKYVRVRAAAGKLELVDARQPGALMDQITAMGLDIDQGMVLKFRDAIYYGPDAIHMVTLMSTRAGFFNRVSYYFFGSKLGSKIFYPAGKVVRNIVLKVLGIRYINNLKQAH